MKKTGLNILCAVLLVLTAVILLWSIFHRGSRGDNGFKDGINQIDLNTIYLENSGVEVQFSDVLLSTHDETRKLIVSEQNGTVSVQLTDRIIQKLDFDFLKKTQKVSYTGKGYFVVDLDNLKKDSIIDDKKNKIVTIKIGHAYLQTVDIDPNNIMIDEVKEGLLARGDIELSVQDYKAIEKEIRAKLVEQFNTAENGQEADRIALKLVKEVYEPVIKAIDRNYQVVVEFK